jgi:hypothetical protein
MKDWLASRVGKRLVPSSAVALGGSNRGTQVGFGRLTKDANWARRIPALLRWNDVSYLTEVTRTNRLDDTTRLS